MSFEGGKTNFHERNEDGEVETTLILDKVSVCPECYEYLSLIRLAEGPRRQDAGGYLGILVSALQGRAGAQAYGTPGKANPECQGNEESKRGNSMSEQQQVEKPESVETLNLSEASVKTLLGKLKRIKAQKDQALGGLVQNMMDTQEELRQKAAPFDQEAEKIEAEIKDLMPQIAHTVKTESGAASYRKGSLRVSYDAKALDAIENKLVQERIAPFRRETTTAPSVSIEVY